MEGLDKNAMKQAKRRWDSVAKPLGSLGVFEDIIINIAGVYKTADVDIRKRCVLVFCADNGVVEEGVTQCGSEVTAAVAENLAKGVTAVCIMAQTAGADVIPVDVGMNTGVICEGIIRKKAGNGTKNIANGPAMTKEQFDMAFNTGRELAGKMKKHGYQLIVTGEMGIGNTTTAAAVASVLLEARPEEITGKGSGLTDDGLKRKIEVIKQAININSPDKKDAKDVIMKVGGFDIAAMAGAFVGGAEHRIPVIIDGVISAAAALAAIMIEPLCRDFMIASHISAEPAAARIMAAIGKNPPIHAGMRLGEGTGGVALLPLLDMAAAVYNSAATFSDSDIEEYKEL